MAAGTCPRTKRRPHYISEKQRKEYNIKESFAWTFYCRQYWSLKPCQLEIGKRPKDIARDQTGIRWDWVGTHAEQNPASNILLNLSGKSGKLGPDHQQKEAKPS